MQVSEMDAFEAMENLRREANFLARNISGCVERYAYSPTVSAMEEGAMVIERLLNQMKG